MSSGSTSRPIPEVPGSVFGAPNLPNRFADTSTSRHIEAVDVRLHAVIGGHGPPLLLVHGWPETWYAWRLFVGILFNPDSLRGSFGWYRALNATAAQDEQRKTRGLTMPVLAIGGEASFGEAVGNAVRAIADDVQSLVIPGAGHFLAEEAPDEILAALTAFLAQNRNVADSRSGP